MGDKRKAKRVDVLGALRGEVLVPQPTLIKQISRTGMQVETAFPLQLGSLHDFRLWLGDRALVVKGRVAHAHISDVDRDNVTYLSGVEFVEMSRVVSAVIAQYVDAISARKPGSP